MTVDDHGGSRLRVGGWIPDEDPAASGPRQPEQPWQAFGTPQGRQERPSEPDGTPSWGAEPSPSVPQAWRERPSAQDDLPPWGAEPTSGAPQGRPLEADVPPPTCEPTHEAPGGVRDLTRADRRADVEGGRRRVAPAVLAGVAGFAVVVIGAVALLSPPDESGNGGQGVFAGGSAAPTGTAADLPSASPSASAAPSPSGSLSPSPSASAAAYVPVGYEAEARGNTLLGQAAVVSLAGASGGAVVRHLGDGSGKKDGALRVNGVSVPVAGAYTLTVHYAQYAGPRAEQVRITVAGSTPVTVAVGAVSGCCASRSVRVVLRQGANTILIDNPSGLAPAVDRIVVGP